MKAKFLGVTDTGGYSMYTIGETEDEVRKKMFLLWKRSFPKSLEQNPGFTYATQLEELGYTRTQKNFEEVYGVNVLKLDNHGTAIL